MQNFKRFSNLYFQGKRERILYTGIRKLPKTKELLPPCNLIQIKTLHKAMVVIQTQTLALKEITFNDRRRVSFSAYETALGTY